jgi:hypothetical protein
MGRSFLPGSWHRRQADHDRRNVCQRGASFSRLPGRSPDTGDVPRTTSRSNTTKPARPPSNAKTTTPYVILICMQIHHRIGALSVVFATLAIAMIAFVPQPASDALAASSRSASSAKHVEFPWKGHGPSCDVRIPTPGFVTYGHFSTCPPKRVLLVGDSVALTMGIQMSLDQEDWGSIVDIAALNGCGFLTGYDVLFQGRFTPGDPHCDNEVETWISDARTFKPQAIVVELGWWDSFQHMINGNIESLTQSQYDTLVAQRILGLVQGLRTASGAAIYFLSVPWMNPPAQPNGQPDPADSAANHNDINRLIQGAAKSSKGVFFVDISPYITPAGNFQTDVGGGICRANDGVHLYYAPQQSSTAVHYVHTQCGKALQNGVLSTIRRDLAKK